jgi:hypothetical protein
MLQASVAQASAMAESTDTSLDDRSLFQPFLQPGEKIIWSGRPEWMGWLGLDNWRPIFLAFMFLSVLPSGVTGVILYHVVAKWGWNGLVEHWDALAALLAFNGLFLGISFTLIRRRLGRLRRTSYALTDRRAMKIEQADQPRLTSSALDLVDRFATDMRRDGSGDLVFGYRNEYVTSDDYGARWEQKPRLVFEDISDVPRVLSLAQEALAKLGYQPLS